jgi:hypothetical protein
MIPQFGGVLGFLAALALFPMIARWGGSLWEAYRDYRLAADYPHLNRRKNLWVFAPLIVLHSGPWLVALTLFGAFKLFTSPHQPWHSWFIGGFITYFALMGFFITRVLKAQKARKVAEHVR